MRLMDVAKSGAHEKNQMADKFNTGKRHSSSSTLSFSTKTTKVTEFARAEKRNKRIRPIEAISEIALNTVGTEDDSKLELKRIHSAPHRHHRLDIGHDNPAYEDNNRNIVMSKQPVNEKSTPIDTYDHQPQSVNSAGIHYGSPNLNSNRPTVHYISGHVNQAYVGPIHGQYPSSTQQNHNTLPTNRVHREQYWSWPCCQQRWTWNWSRREKTLALIILGQSFIIFGLVIALLKILLTEKDITIGKPGILEPPWNMK